MARCRCAGCRHPASQMRARASLPGRRALWPTSSSSSTAGVACQCRPSPRAGGWLARSCSSKSCHCVNVYRYVNRTVPLYCQHTAACFLPRLFVIAEKTGRATSSAFSKDTLPRDPACPCDEQKRTAHEIHTGTRTLRMVLDGGGFGRKRLLCAALRNVSSTPQKGSCQIARPHFSRPVDIARLFYFRYQYIGYGHTLLYSQRHMPFRGPLVFSEVEAAQPAQHRRHAAAAAASHELAVCCCCPPSVQL